MSIHVEFNLFFWNFFYMLEQLYLFKSCQKKLLPDLPRELISSKLSLIGLQCSWIASKKGSLKKGDPKFK